MKKYVTILLLFVHINYVFGQDCSIENIARKVLDISNLGLINKEYNNLKKKDSIDYNIMLIKMSSGRREQICYLLTTDLKTKFTCKIISNDSIIFCKSIHSAEKYKETFFLNNTWLNGFFYTKCKDFVLSGSKEVLIICNNSLNLWTECASFDGKMKEALNSNNKYYYLNEAYKLIEKEFSELGIYENQ